MVAKPSALSTGIAPFLSSRRSNVRLEPRVIDRERAHFIPERRFSDRRLGENGRRRGERADCGGDKRRNTWKRRKRLPS